MNAGKKLLFVIDAPEARGGAHIASYRMMDELVRRGWTVSVMGALSPTEEFQKAHDNVRFESVDLSITSWPRRPLFAFYRHALHRFVYPAWLLDPLGRIRRKMRRYDVVCVMSETSLCRPLVSKLPRVVRKVQLIHTNYKLWRKFDPYAKVVTPIDGRLYRPFDVVAAIGVIGACEMQGVFPHLSKKIFPFHNVIPPLKTEATYSPAPKVRLLTLARIDDGRCKDGMRMIRVAAKLKRAGIDFEWHVYGNTGGFTDEAAASIAASDVADCFLVHPFRSNIGDCIRQSDLMVLLSHYEGLPNVIYEAMTLGTPVFTTAVGGIPEQIRDGQNGWLVPDDEKAIVDGLARVLSNRSAWESVRRMLAGYEYPNKDVVDEFESLLVGKES